MSLGELVRGAHRVKDKVKRERYKRWIDHDLASQFQGRVLPFDQEAAVIWGEIMGDGDRTGRPKPMGDAQIAAVARRHDLTLVTRNTGISRIWMWLLSIHGSPAHLWGEGGHWLSNAPPVVLCKARGRNKAGPRATHHVTRHPRYVEQARALRHGVCRRTFAIPYKPTLWLQPERIEVGVAQVESEADGLSG